MNQVQFQAPPLSKVNKIILITVGVGFVISAILKAIGAFSLVSIFGLSASALFSGHIYQLLTYPFIETQLMSVLFNCLIVWFIGSELELQWGTRVYVRFLLLNVLGVALIYSLVNLFFFFGTPLYHTPIYSLSGINFAMLIAYAVIYPHRQMSLMLIFPVTARTFCLVLVGIEAYMAIFSSFTSSWAHLLAMGISYLIIRFQARPMLRKLLNNPLKTKKSGKAQLYVVKDENQKPPKYWQ